MIKKLKGKFILVSLLSVFFVLFLTVGAINVINYVNVESQAGDALKMVLEQGGQEPVPGQQPGGGPGRTDVRQEHYFIVSFASDGTVTSSNTRHMFTYSEAECIDLASKVFRNEISGGKYGTLRFSKQTKQLGSIDVAFVDIKERLDSFHSFLGVSSGISLGAYAVMAGLVILASNLVFRPSEEAYKKQKRFITNASHELKTPLTVISADMDIVEMDAGKSEWTESVRDQVKRLTEMTNQLVTLSKLEEEDASFPFEDFPLDEVCKGISEAFAPLFAKEGIEFSYNCLSKISMHGNKRLLEQLISSMLDNSLKYTGGDKKSSYFTLTETKGRIEMRFSNTLDKEDEVDASQILDRFYRSPSNKKEGSGVGLSIVSEIASLHKGKVKAEKSGNTLSFLITFR